MVMPNTWLPSPNNTGASIGDAPPPAPISSPIITTSRVQFPTSTPGMVIDGGNQGITLNSGAIVLANFQQLGSSMGLSLRGGLYLSGGNGTAISVGALWAGAGVPGGGLGNNGDYYFRNDTPGTANQRIYCKIAGAWTGIV